MKPVYDYWQPDHGPKHIKDLSGVPVGTRFEQVLTTEVMGEFVLAGSAFLHPGGFWVIPAIYLRNRPSGHASLLMTLSLHDSGISPLDHEPLLYHQYNWLKRVDTPPMPLEEIKQHLEQMLTWFRDRTAITDVRRCLADLDI